MSKLDNNYKIKGYDDFNNCLNYLINIFLKHLKQLKPTTNKLITIDKYRSYIEIFKRIEKIKYDKNYNILNIEKIILEYFGLKPNETIKKRIYSYPKPKNRKDLRFRRNYRNYRRWNDNEDNEQKIKFEKNITTEDYFSNNSIYNSINHNSLFLKSDPLFNEYDNIIYLINKEIYNIYIYLFHEIKNTNHKYFSDKVLIELQKYKHKYQYYYVMEQLLYDPRIELGGKPLNFVLNLLPDEFRNQLRDE